MKLCPTCDREFEEDLDACPDDGTPLVTAGRANNPRLPGVKQVSNDAATSMFTLEEVKNEKERLNRAVERGDAPEEEDAVPDREATRALTPDDLERMKNARNAFAEGQDETMTASAVRKILREAGARLPSKARAPRAKAISVAIGMPAPA